MFVCACLCIILTVRGCFSYLRFLSLKQQQRKFVVEAVQHCIVHCLGVCVLDQSDSDSRIVHSFVLLL